MTDETKHPMPKSFKASGIVLNLNLAKIGVMSMPDQPGLAGVVLGVLCRNKINVLLIVEAADLQNRSHIILCVEEAELKDALAAIESVQVNVQAEQVIHRENVVMVSVYGPHFRDKPGIAGRAFSALAGVGINLLAISSSLSTVSCVITSENLKLAVTTLKKAFSVPDSAVAVMEGGLTRPAKL